MRKREGGRVGAAVRLAEQHERDQPRDYPRDYPRVPESAREYPREYPRVPESTRENPRLPEIARDCPRLRLVEQYERLAARALQDGAHPRHVRREGREGLHLFTAAGVKRRCSQLAEKVERDCTYSQLEV